MKKYYNSPELMLEIMIDDVILNSGNELFDTINVLEDDYDRAWGSES